MANPAGSSSGAIQVIRRRRTRSDAAGPAGRSASSTGPTSGPRWLGCSIFVSVSRRVAPNRADSACTPRTAPRCAPPRCAAVSAPRWSTRQRRRRARDGRGSSVQRRAILGGAGDARDFVRGGGPATRARAATVERLLELLAERGVTMPAGTPRSRASCSPSSTGAKGPMESGMGQRRRRPSSRSAGSSTRRWRPCSTPCATGFARRHARCTSRRHHAGTACVAWCALGWSASCTSDVASRPHRQVSRLRRRGCRHRTSAAARAVTGVARADTSGCSRRR